MDQTWPGTSLCSNAPFELWPLVMHVKTISVCKAKHIHNHCYSCVVSHQPSLTGVCTARARLMPASLCCPLPLSPLLSSSADIPLSLDSADQARGKAARQSGCNSPERCCTKSLRAQGDGCSQEKPGTLQGFAIQMNHCRCGKH